MKTSRPGIAIVAALAAMATPAPASPMRDPAATSIAVAAGFWGQPAWCGTPRIEFAPEIEPGVNGWTSLDTCVISLPTTRQPGPQWSPFELAMHWSVLCDTVVHEYGHLVGQDHDAAVAVMRHHRTSRVQQCLDAFLPPPSWAQVSPQARRFYQYQPGDAIRRHREKERARRRASRREGGARGR